MVRFDTLAPSKRRHLSSTGNLPVPFCSCEIRTSGHRLEAVRTQGSPPPPIRTQYHKVISLHRRTSVVIYVVTVEHHFRPSTFFGGPHFPRAAASLLQIYLNCNSLQMNTCATPRLKPFTFNTCENRVGGYPLPLSRGVSSSYEPSAWTARGARHQSARLAVLFAAETRPEVLSSAHPGGM